MCAGSIEKAKTILEKKSVYESLEEIVNKIDSKDLIEVLNNAEILYKSKDNIQELLDYINIILYNKKELKYINCIPIVEEVKRRLLQNSNYDMSIDGLLIRMWEEVNEEYNRG